MVANNCNYSDSDKKSLSDFSRFFKIQFYYSKF